ncbi:MAG: hypothetical protein Q8R35_01865 [bacterium]|nr:hypothetical protein [bacterium]
MTNRMVETDRLLAWFDEVLRGADAVDVDIVVVDKPGSGSSLQIIIHDVPAPLAGLALRQVQPSSRGGSSLPADEQIPRWVLGTKPSGAGAGSLDRGFI